SRVGGKRQSLGHRLSRRRPSIFCCRVPRECPVHGQGLDKVCRNWWLGIRRLHERQTWERGAAPNLLRLPPARQRSRLRLHPLRTLILRVRGYPCIQSWRENLAKVAYDKQLTALLVIDPYNDFISEGGKVWDRLKDVAEANNCVPHMLQVLNAARNVG